MSNRDFLHHFPELNGIEKIYTGRNSWISTLNQLVLIINFAIDFLLLLLHLHFTNIYTEIFLNFSTHGGQISNFFNVSTHTKLKCNSYSSMREQTNLHLNNIIFSICNSHICWSAYLNSSMLERKCRLLEEILQSKHILYELFA